MTHFVPVCVMLLSALAQAPTTQPYREALPPGRHMVCFESRAEQGKLPELDRRFGWRLASRFEAYDPAGESYVVVVPPDPPPNVKAKPPGVLVWVSASESGEPPAAWLPALAEHRLIWIGAMRSGNERKIIDRFGLAIDAALGVQKAQRVDPTRVYVAGVSGGGRVASMLAPMFPDVFTGGLFIVGCNYFKPLLLPDDPTRHWRPSFQKPAEEFLKPAQQRSRFVLLTGEKDENRAQTLATYEQGYREDGFQNVTYLEVPGMGHALPDREWFDRAVRALDQSETR